MTLYSARIGDIVTGRAPDVLEALALGSCVAVFIFDEVNKVGSCAHVLLPASTAYTKKHDIDNKPGKYADLAIPEILRELSKKGAKRDRLKAKIAGGAKMFELTNPQKSLLDVGARNIISVKEHLKENNIPVISEDVGGDFGRTVQFDLETLILTIKIGLTKTIRRI